MIAQQHDRQVDDLNVAIAAALVRPDQSVVDLTNKNVLFTMLDSVTGVPKIAETSASVISSTSGFAAYAPVAADVDEEGTFFGYFVVTNSSGGQRDTFPVKKGAFKVVIEDHQ